MWIDQGTGSIIDQSEAQVRKLDDGTTVLDLELSFTDETVAENVEDAKANNSQLNLVGPRADRPRDPRRPRPRRRPVPHPGRPFGDDHGTPERGRHAQRQAQLHCRMTRPMLRPRPAHEGAPGRETAVPIEEGLLRTIGWFRTHHWLV